MRFRRSEHAEACPSLALATPEIVYLEQAARRSRSSSTTSSSSSSTSSTSESSSSSSAAPPSYPSTSPSPCDPSPFTPAGTLRGSLSFTLARPKCFKTLTVNLQGTLVVNYPAGQVERTTTLTHDADLLYSHSPHFAAGVHTLEFAILLPASVTPSFDCAQGTQSYSLRACAQGHDGSPWFSQAKEVEFIAAATQSRNDCLVDIVSYNDAVGPFAARLVSEPPAIGSLLHFYLHLPSPTVGVTLLHISLSVLQSVHLQSSDRRTTLQNAACVVKPVVLLRTWNTPNGFQDALRDPGHTSGLPPWAPGDEIELERQLRLPSHRHFSPSTPKGLKQNLRISHALQIKIRYRQANGLVKELQILRDFQLLSCKCLADTVIAPPYTAKDPHPKVRKSRLLQDVCACTTRIEHATLLANLKDRPAAPPDCKSEEEQRRSRRALSRV